MSNCFIIRCFNTVQFRSILSVSKYKYFLQIHVLACLQVDMDLAVYNHCCQHTQWPPCCLHCPEHSQTQFPNHPAPTGSSHHMSGTSRGIHWSWSHRWKFFLPLPHLQAPGVKQFNLHIKCWTKLDISWRKKNEWNTWLHEKKQIFHFISLCWPGKLHLNL